MSIPKNINLFSIYFIKRFKRTFFIVEFIWKYLSDTVLNKIKRNFIENFFKFYQNAKHYWERNSILFVFQSFLYTVAYKLFLARKRLKSSLKLNILSKVIRKVTSLSFTKFYDFSQGISSFFIFFNFKKK